MASGGLEARIESQDLVKQDSHRHYREFVVALKSGRQIGPLAQIGRLTSSAQREP